MERPVEWQGRPIRTWADFHRLVRPGRRLLARLDDFPGSILVAGCQRSGTTAVARVLRQADGVADHAFGTDDELDGALLLAGYVDRIMSGRHCFQTTYLNDRFPEYFEHEGFRLIWILREPRAVVHSMLYNWKRGALNRLFEACGRDHAPAIGHRASIVQRLLGCSRIDKACASYIAKTAQTITLRQRLGSRLLVVDYSDLVQQRLTILQRIFDFAGVPFDRQQMTHLHSRSVHTGDRLARWQRKRIDGACASVYREARLFIDKEYEYA